MRIECLGRGCPKKETCQLYSKNAMKRDEYVSIIADCIRYDIPLDHADNDYPLYSPIKKIMRNKTNHVALKTGVVFVLYTWACPGDMSQQ